MKTTIEKHVDNSFFNRILYVIKISVNRDDMFVRMNMIFNVLEGSKDFKFGFGGSHMWVANQQNERLIIVTF